MVDEKTTDTQQETVATESDGGGDTNGEDNGSKDTTLSSETPESTSEDSKALETESSETKETRTPDSTTADSAEEKPSERVVPKPDEYKLPEGTPKELGQFAHDNGYTQEQLDAAIKMFDGYSKANVTAQQIALRQLGEAHVKNWGDEANFKLSLAKRALKQNDPEGALAKALNESGYGNHPAVLDFLANLGEQMREGGFLKSAVNRPPGKKSLAQAMFPDHPSTEM